MKDALHTLADSLDRAGDHLSRSLVVAGFDGFVDEMITVVDERQRLDSYRPMPSIDSFGQWVCQAAGRSSLKEIVVNRQDAGGCAVNLSDGLIGLDIQLDLYATLGAPQASAFNDVARSCRRCESWGDEPGRTLAFEFPDGKLMFASISQLGEFDPALVEQAIANGTFTDSCTAANALAFTNWTLYPHMTACWHLIQQRVLADCQQRPWIFIDLVDPRSRSASDIERMLETLTGFQQHGPTVLGLNLNEANAIAGLLNENTIDEDPAAMQAQAAAIRERLGIEQVVTHALRHAAVASASGTANAPGPYTPNPKKSVGAGDRFNAGYLAGLLLDLSDQQRLLLGNAASGFFVREARSATLLELAAFCRSWN